MGQAQIASSSFLGHVGFYRRFIRDFSKISKPLSTLLMQGVPFDFDDSCMKAFETLNEKLTSTPIIVALDRELPFELMCDASDYVVDTVSSLNERTKFSMLFTVPTES